MRTINKDSLKFIVISFSLALTFILISESVFYDKALHQIFNIGHELPSFLDFRCYQSVIPTIEAGFNPYINNPFDQYNRPFNLPYIWIPIVSFMNLDNEIIFNLVIFLFIFFYCYAVLKVINLLNCNYTILISFFLIFSSSSMLLIERGNTDMLIFYLILYAALSTNFLKSSGFIFLASILKVYPIFAFFINFKSKKNFLLGAMFSVVAFVTFFQKLKFFYSGTSSGNATSFTFGFSAISKGILKSLDRLNINLPEHYLFNPLYIHITLIIIVLLFILAVFLINKKNFFKINFTDIRNRLFLAGSSIYCGCFVFFSSYDYRLIFLILTIPYFFDRLNKFYIVYLIFVFLSLNSLILFSVAKSPIEFLYIGAIIHFFKLSIFLLLIYELTKFLDYFYWKTLKESSK